MKLIILLLTFLFFANSSATFYFDYCPMPRLERTNTVSNVTQLSELRKQVRKIHYDKVTLPEKMLNKDFLITMTELRELEAEDCGLTRIDLQIIAKIRNRVPVFPKLITLSLKNNHISEIKDGCFKSCMVLEQLDLSNNNISLIDQPAWAGMKELQELDLSSNRIIHLDCDFGNVQKLEKLDLSRNWLSYVDLNSFNNNSKLQSLNLKHNNIKRIEPSQRELGLTDVDLSSNFLTELSSLNNAPRIEHLSLSNNQMLALHRNTFSQWMWKMKSLHIMALRKWSEEGYEILNHLVNLKSLSVGMATKVNRLNGLKQLETLTIDGSGQNKISEREIKTQFPKLKKIIYEVNHWEQQSMDKKGVVELLFKYKKIFQIDDEGRISEENTYHNYFLAAYVSVLLIAVLCHARIVQQKHKVLLEDITDA